MLAAFSGAASSREERYRQTARSSALCFLPHAFKKTLVFLKLLNLPEEQIRDGGGMQMNPSWLLSACRLTMYSRKWEGLRLWFWPGFPPYLAPVISRESWGIPLQPGGWQGVGSWPCGAEPVAGVQHSPVQHLPSASFCAERFVKLFFSEKSVHITLITFQSRY